MLAKFIPLTQGTPGPRERMLKLSIKLTAAFETLNETLQRIGRAEIYYLAENPPTPLSKEAKEREFALAR